MFDTEQIASGSRTGGRVLLFPTGNRSGSYNPKAVRNGYNRPLKTIFGLTISTGATIRPEGSAAVIEFEAARSGRP